MIRENLIILAVDDDMINLKLLKSMLKKSGKTTEVIEASNGYDAINILKSKDDIDLVLLDIIMPIMGGIQTLKAIRADSKISKTPIIVLTTDDTKQEEALEVGANDFLTKPIRRDELLKKIDIIFS